MSSRHPKTDPYVKGRPTSARTNKTHQTKKAPISSHARETGAIPKRKPSNIKHGQLSMKKLGELRNKSAAQIMLALKADHSGLKDFLKRDFNKGDTIMVWAILAVACGTELKDNLAELLKIIVDAYHFTVHQLQRYLMGLQYGFCTRDDISTLENVTTVLEALAILEPSIILPIMTLVLPNLIDTVKYHLDAVGQDLLLRLEGLRQNKDTLKERYTIQLDTSNCKDQPSDNFREIPVIPNKNDIIRSTVPFLRANVVEGRYQNVDHYLDVQFRLIREDYVRPLREGINAYIQQLSNGNREKIRDIKAYYNVKVVSTKISNDGVSHEIQIPLTGYLKNIQWNTSKRLIYGTLLCITFNTFDTVFFATVQNRSEVSKNGHFDITVRFEDKDLFEIDNNFDKTYLVIETQSYFEGYRHVLAALQTISENTFPLKEYIVHVDKKINPPAYASNETLTYCSNTIFTGPGNDSKGNESSDSSYRRLYDKVDACNCEKPNVLPIHDFPKWLDKNNELDKSQIRALHSALTHSISIIQGPPGTGKTFLGLKIVEILLHNRFIWSTRHDDNPILVICYTNHALDQFLEGILKFTNNIVRIGGRSKNQNMEKYNLKELRREKRTFLEKNNLEGKLQNIIGEMNELRTCIANTHTFILRDSELKPDMVAPLWNSLQFQSPPHILPKNDSDKILRFWLEIEIPEYRFGEQSKKIDSEKATRFNHKESAQPQQCFNPELRYVQVNELTTHSSDALEDAVDVEFIEDQRMGDDEHKDARVIYEYKKNNMDTSAMYQENPKIWSNPEKESDEKILLRNLVGPQMSNKEIKSCRNVWKLKIHDRWRLYRSLLKMYTMRIEQDVISCKEKYYKVIRLLEEISMERNRHALKDAYVVGATTSGAAKHKRLLQSLKSKIIVVEEAAEVLEAHIVTALNTKTQHIILIGDHQQLRPNPTVYELAKKYNMEVSLFERLIRNGLPFSRLDIQHRMKPCISRLLVPNIYENLKDHPSVHDYNDVKGLEKSMFFISHTSMENYANDSASRSNIYEARFLISLCRYLLLQGYAASQITILTTYLAQFFVLKDMLNTKLLKEVRVSVVDNFQGEENDIILLSFVRSNEEGVIGFLKTENRVCVALSRAKKGLFCVGNFELLFNKSVVWEKILDKLRNEEAVGSVLHLKCQIHGNITPVLNDEDFSKAKDGGCSKPCDVRLKCGHVCPKMCHPDDPDHVKYNCLKPCALSCVMGHECPKLCYETCECVIMVDKNLPRCEHLGHMKCHMEPEDFLCMMPCERKCQLDHKCPKYCNEKCLCVVLVDKKLPRCEHVFSMKCSKDPAEHKCSMPCQRSLTCGHTCPYICGKNCCQQCKVKVCKIIPLCQHEITVYCYMDLNGVICELPCPKILSCGHPCTEICGKECAKCIVKVIKTIPECQHETLMSCYKDPTKFLCRVPCLKTLTCGHTCTGICGKECANCIVKVKKIIPSCQHETLMSCYKDPTKSLCRLPCLKTLACEHPCTEICGNPCPECQVIVSKSFPLCQHEIALPCHTDISKQICKFACEKLLDCGHPCKQFCGESCGGCVVIINQLSPCGHNVKIECRFSKDKSKLQECCKMDCERKLVCGHKCSNFCKDQCIDYCEFKINHQLRCGHTKILACAKSKEIETMCWDFVSDPLSSCFCKTDHTALSPRLPHSIIGNDEKSGSGLLKYFTEIALPRKMNSFEEDAICSKACMLKLECGHICKGNCCICDGGRIHVLCQERCNKILACGHTCTYACTMTCPPCTRSCPNGCAHSPCRMPCGYPCSPCTRPCSWRCPHFSCSRLCNEPCDRPPCDLPCWKTLACGHVCTAFCGEPCPQKCLECAAEVYVRPVNIKVESRFVLLEDCKHVIEVGVLTSCLLKQRISTMTVMQLLCCPVCNRPILKNVRFNIYIKEALAKLESIKVELFYELSVMPKRLLRLKRYLPQIHFYPSRKDLFLTDPCFIFQAIKASLVSGKQEQNLSMLPMKEEFVAIAEESEQIQFDFKAIVSNKLMLSEEQLRSVRELFGITLRAISSKILTNQNVSSDQVVFDISWEIRRLTRTISFLKQVQTIPELNYNACKEQVSMGLSKLVSTRQFRGDDEAAIASIQTEITAISSEAACLEPNDCLGRTKPMSFRKDCWIFCKGCHLNFRQSSLNRKEPHCSECGLELKTDQPIIGILPSFLLPSDLTSFSPQERLTTIGIPKPETKLPNTEAQNSKSLPKTVKKRKEIRKPTPTHSSNTNLKKIHKTNSKKLVSSKAGDRSEAKQEKEDSISVDLKSLKGKHSTGRNQSGGESGKPERSELKMGTNLTCPLENQLESKDRECKAALKNEPLYQPERKEKGKFDINNSRKQTKPNSNQKKMVSKNRSKDKPGGPMDNKKGSKDGLLVSKDNYKDKSGGSMVNRNSSQDEGERLVSKGNSKNILRGQKPLQKSSFKQNNVESSALNVNDKNGLTLDESGKRTKLNYNQDKITTKTSPKHMYRGLKSENMERSTQGRYEDTDLKERFFRHPRNNKGRGQNKPRAQPEQKNLQLSSGLDKNTILHTSHKDRLLKEEIPQIKEHTTTTC